MHNKEAVRKLEWRIKQAAKKGWDNTERIELHRIAKDVVHNRYVDHVDHASEFSPQHHHHGEGTAILIHAHEGKFDHHHIIYLGNYDRHYGAAKHDHKVERIALDSND